MRYPLTQIRLNRLFLRVFWFASNLLKTRDTFVRLEFYTFRGCSRNYQVAATFYSNKPTKRAKL